MKGDKHLKKVLITTSTFGEYENKPIELLKSNNLEVKLNPYQRKVTSEELNALLNNEVAYLIAGTEKITEEIMKNNPSLKVISRCGVAMDNVDLEASKRHNIAVYNTPYGPTKAVAELTIGLILSLLRKITIMDKQMRQNLWKKQMGSLLSNKVLGIIGLGKIGKQMVNYLTPFELTILAYDIYKEDDFASKNNIQYVELEDLLRQSDIVSVNISYSENTKNLIDLNRLKLMKNPSYLINVSRGGIVNEEDLYTALKENIITGAAVDTFEEEPYKGKLLELDNIILTPHIGSYAIEGRIYQELAAVENIINHIKNE